MAVYIGSKKIKELYYGGKKIKEAWYSGKKVFSSSAPLWVQGRYYNKGDQVTVDIYGDIYRYTASSAHYSVEANKPFFGYTESDYWSSPTKVN